MQQAAIANTLDHTANEDHIKQLTSEAAKQQTIVHPLCSAAAFPQAHTSIRMCSTPPRYHKGMDQ
jgi:hypothetical protein